MRSIGMEDAIEDVFTKLNTLSSDSDSKIAVVHAFSRTHYTLQQSFVRNVIIPILKYLAKEREKGNYDLRNKAASLLAVKMLAAVTEDDLYLPLI